jgi:hypothetical protein
MRSCRCDSLSRVHFSRQLRRGLADDAGTMEERERKDHQPTPHFSSSSLSRFAHSRNSCYASSVLNSQTNSRRAIVRHLPNTIYLLAGADGTRQPPAGKNDDDIGFALCP